jgi:hypothetical protein
MLPVIQGDNHCFKDPFLKVNLYADSCTRKYFLLGLCPIDILSNRVSNTMKGIVTPTMKGEM